MAVKQPEEYELHVVCGVIRSKHQALLRLKFCVSMIVKD